MKIKRIFFVITAMALAAVLTGCSNEPATGKPKSLRGIVTSDTLLSEITGSLLPGKRYCVEAIIPPGQCPGHYDVKLSDIEKMKKADLVVSWREMPFLDKGSAEGALQLLVPWGKRNWMAPDSYLYGLGGVAEELSKRFPEDRDEIMRRMAEKARAVKTVSQSLKEKLKHAEIPGKTVIGSFMQKEVLEWMGFRVVGAYGRQDAMSAREVVRLTDLARNQHIVMVVDNLQSGPDTGKSIAAALAVPHVVLTNFPTENGYLATLGENVNAVLAASVEKP
jgi:zinc transport system substrate-binding protein